MPTSKAPAGLSGRVLCIRPTQGIGILLAESGEELAFQLSTGDVQVEGGDLIELQVHGGGQPLRVTSIRVQARWADELNTAHRALVNEFHRTVRVRRDSA